MDDEAINQYVTMLTDQLIAASGQITQLKASVRVLKVVLANEMNRNHPATALRLFRRLERKLCDADPSAQEQKEAASIIEDWKKHYGRK